MVMNCPDWKFDTRVHMHTIDPNDLQAVWLTLKLASITTFLLLLIGTPLSWWLAHSSKWYSGVVAALVALP